MKNKVIDELKQHFRPEFLNRVDDTIVFPQLTQAEIVAIVDLEIAKLDTRLKDKDMGMELTVGAKNLLAKKGYDPVLGARPLRRTIQREIEDVLSEKILYGELKSGEFVLVDTAWTEERGLEGRHVHLHRQQARGDPPRDPGHPAGRRDRRQWTPGLDGRRLRLTPHRKAASLGRRPSAYPRTAGYARQPTKSWVTHQTPRASR